MKPHLPVSLFRSLVAALAAFPLLSYAAREHVPAEFTDNQIFAITDLADVENLGVGNDRNAFLLSQVRTATVTNPTLRNNDASVFDSSRVDIFFTSNDDRNRCSMHISEGSIAAGDISFVALNDVTVERKEEVADVRNSTSIGGNALVSSALMFSDHLGEYDGFDDTSKTILFDENRTVTINQNSINLTVSTNGPVNAFVAGAAVCGPNVELIRNRSVTFSGNSLSASASGEDVSMGAAYGAAVYAANLRIQDNADVVVSGNSISADTSSGEEGVAVGGGAFYVTRSLTITGNVSVVFGNNSEHFRHKDDELTYLRSVVVDSDNAGRVTLSAAVSNHIEFQESITADCDVNLNADFTDSSGTLRKGEGDIIFNGAYVEDRLTALNGGNNPTEDMLRESFTTFVQGTSYLGGGHLKVVNGAVYSGGGLVAARNSASTVYLNRGSLSFEPTRNDADTADMGDGRLVLGAETTLYVRDDGNSIVAEEISFEGKSTFTFDLTSRNVLNVALSVDADMVFEDGVTVYLTSDSKLTNQAPYKLFELAEDCTLTGWNSSNITVISNKDTGYEASYANLRWADNVMYYYTVLPLLLDATWTNHEGDFIWSSNAINWEQEGQFYPFSNGATATFGDEGYGTIELMGELRPSAILVDNSVDAPYVWKAHAEGGFLSGDAKLTKQGAGTLTIALANQYSGGTEVLGGSLIAGHAEAFGTGDILVNGGMLDTSTYAVKNKVTVESGAFAGTAYDGDLTIVGTAAIGEKTTAATVTLSNATIVGGSFVDTDITSTSANIETVLEGKTNLTVDEGKTVLTGAHTSTGLTTIKGGTLQLDGTMRSDVDLKGGILSVTQSPMVLVDGQDMTMNGGTVTGSIETAEGATLSVPQTGSISGELILNGGTYTPGGAGITLQVGRELNISSATVVDLVNYENGGNYTLITAGNIVGSVDMLTPVTDTRNINTISVSGLSLVLKVVENPATLYWQEGAEGTWEALSNQLWDTTADDARFFNRDSVVFDKGGKAEIVGEVRPADVLVSGDDEMTLSGKGSIVGATSLTKRGAGTLNMNAKNSYTGGTLIEAGTVNAGGEESFGSGSIELRGGRLDMMDHGVRNDVMASAGEFAGTAYDGKLTVRGDITVGADTTAASVELAEGSISGGSLRNTEIKATGLGEIRAAIKDAASVVVDGGDLLLDAKNTYTGTTTVNQGALRIGREEAIGSGDIVLNGGKLYMAKGNVLTLTGQQKLVFNGGQVEGNVRTSNAAAMVLDSNATINGNLRMNGGSVYYNALDKSKVKGRAAGYIASNGCTLNVNGVVNLTADTMLVLQSGQYADGDVLMECESLTGDFGYLVLNYDDGNPNTEFAITKSTTENGKVQLLLDLDKVYESTGGKWTMSHGAIRDLLVQSNWGMMASSHAFSDAMQGQRSASGVVGENGPMVWVSALYSHLTVDDDKGLNGAETSAYGAAFGVESMIGSSSCIGLAIGVTSADVSPSGMAETMEQEGIYFGVYGATVLGRLSDRSGLTLSWNAAYGSVDSSPSTAPGSVEWSQDSWQIGTRLDWSCALREGVSLNVFGGLEYFSTSAATSIGIDSGEIQNVRAELGVGVTRSFSASVLYAEARYINDVARDNPTPTINGWSAEGANPGRSGFGLRVGAAHDINRNWSVGANYGVEMMGDAVNHSANVSASFKF